MLKRSRALASVAVIAVFSGMGAPAWAETLRDAIALAYQTNPSLLAQRANQRALDESIVQARAGLRPRLDVTLSGSHTQSYGDRAGFDGDSASASIGLSQTLWTGGRIGHGITAAEADILAGRENLRDIEQTVLASVIQAYADVIRDAEILRIRQANLGVLQRQLEEASARFEVGEITRTDVAQSEARLAQSEADLANAQAQLSVSRASYAAVVGQSPGDLAPMPALPGVPSDFDDALDVALRDNPGIRAAAYNLRAAEANAAAARSEYLPSARLTASYGGSNADFDRIGDIGDNQRLTAGATVSVPLFTGGLNGSRVAQALERANVAQINVEGERRNTLQSVSSAYAQALSARSSLQAGTEAVRAATVAAEGVRQEAQVGLRTTLDVLNQELELRNAEVTLANARRNEYVAQANLLAAMGRLEGADLDPTLTIYNPADNYERVRNRGALPWDGVIESFDRVLAPPIVPANDAADAPIDQRLKSGIVQTAPRD
ncbi:TolC family outer membrane protein [Brevundimonas basaltis]|uniref:Outer membrane protein n=1 Tax=Brevundimonas basaltis TaxID=472166 RepID=A0A7W8HWH3_9CAUL|nr:TolC family outer membrane protein [Brevundimonas basaltis]MBB5291065.1 outer membrane protein [Brevundimonas basaltis]